MGRISILILLLALSFAGTASSVEEGIDRKLEERRKDLQEIKQKIAKEKESVQRDIQQEKEISADLGEIRRQLKEKKKEAAKLQGQIDRGQSRVKELNREIQASQSRLVEAKSLLAGRMRAMYKQGRTGMTSLLLSVESLQQVAIDLHYLQAIARHDRELIHNFKLAIAAYQGKKEEVARQVEMLTADQRALKETQEEIAQDEERMKIFLAQVRSDKASRLKRLSELQRSSAALQDLIGKLQEKMKALQASAPKGAEMVFLQGLHFPAAKGKLAWPTKGDLLAAFGRQEHPRYHTFTLNKGIDIGAPMGEEIKAVFEGIVLFADWFRGYGKMAIIDHGQGFYSLYAHASDLLVKVGDKVSPRQLIGRVGNSGSPEGPRLHFEIRQNGKPVNPLHWLVPNP